MDNDIANMIRRLAEEILRLRENDDLNSSERANTFRLLQDVDSMLDKLEGRPIGLEQS